MKRPALPLTGGCPCEAVRFEVTAMPLLVYACHCTEWQRWSGNAFSMSMPVASDTFRIVRGEPKPWRRIGASGVQSTYWFCGACGGRVYGERDAGPDITAVGYDWTYGFKIEAPVVTRPSRSMCALAASFSA
jgi:hypothetical protein